MFATRQRTASQTIDEENIAEEGGTVVDNLEKEASLEVASPPNLEYDMDSLSFWQRFKGKGRRKIGILQSLIAFTCSSWINIFLIFIPFAWAAHFQKEWSRSLAFIFSFLSIMALESIFDFGGEQMALYCGKEIGDLIVITMNNSVEATLGIILLFKCELKLLQSTIAGVVILHLLLVPGTAFITGGARIWEQQLHPHTTEANHTLLTVGIMTLLIPAAFFAALNGGIQDVSPAGLLNDSTRDMFLKMSRGVSVMLLIIYISSRIFIFNPPGEIHKLHQHPDTPEELKQHVARLAHTEAKVNQWVCLAVLVTTIAIMAATAEWLVDSIDNVSQSGNIQKEWFGLILLPIVSFSGDGAVAILYFIRYYCLSRFMGVPSPPTTTLAKGRAIDLSIQFTLFWMPFMVLLGWWASKPMNLLFDIFEVALLLAACFLVNYVTADSKTNWLEGLVLVMFYLMIVLCAWFYTGQAEIDTLLACESVAAALAGGVGR